MTRAYVRIKTALGKEIVVRDSLRKFPGVVCAYITVGEQDVISLVEGDSAESIFNIVISKIRALEGVEGTMTSLIVDR